MSGLAKLMRPNWTPMIPLRYAAVTTRFGYSHVRAGYTGEKYFVPATSL
jgi:hypothetical protein